METTAIKPKLTLVEFGKINPTVVYDYVGVPPENWKFFWDGWAGLGYYKLTKNGRRNPKGYFKDWKTVHKEYINNRCIILNK
jgi:hypothetical protein